MITSFKVRQNSRQWPFLVIIFIGVSLVVLKFVHTNAPLNIMGENYGVSQAVQFEETIISENVVPVPISQIMSGKPIVLPQDDKRIIKYIWSNNHILLPSEDAYNLRDTETDPSRGQGQYIRGILKNMTNGFFVECGALDGETRSNTLFMEKNLGWKGLLVEGDPSNFALLKKKNRKACMANTCLSVKPYPHTANFLQKFNTGKVLGTEEASSVESLKHVQVQCMPLFSLLMAINITTVDYFSLDVEGSELQVLKTIPFDKVNIRHFRWNTSIQQRGRWKPLIS